MARGLSDIKTHFAVSLKINNMKRVLFASIAWLAIFLAVVSLVGFPPSYLIAAPGVATGIGSKLLCSSYYVSGLSKEQSFNDLLQYSGILQKLSIEYDEMEKTVTTSLFGFSEKTASYIPNIGCAVDYPGFGQRAALQTERIPVSDAKWPAGDAVGAADSAMQDLLEGLLAMDNEAGFNTRAFLVAHKGRVIAETYGQGADADTPLIGWSMAKSLMAIMLANLEYRGILDLQASPDFGPWQDDERSQIRIIDMLTMTDGLVFSEKYRPGDDVTALLFTEPSASDFAMEKESLHAAGNRFNYSSGTASLLARVYFEKAGGDQASYDDYMENIYQAFAFQNAVFELDVGGVFMSSSYLYASARDWARIGQLMLNDGVINGRRIVADDWVERATAVNTSENEKAYGYQWWLNRGNEELRWADLPQDAFSAKGNREQYLMVVPSQELLIVRLGWTTGVYPANDRFAEIIAKLSTMQN